MCAAGAPTNPLSPAAVWVRGDGAIIVRGNVVTGDQERAMFGPGDALTLGVDTTSGDFAFRNETRGGGFVVLPSAVQVGGAQRVAQQWCQWRHRRA